MTRPLGVGVIGAGVISHAYLGTICRSPELELIAVSSAGMASARAQAARYGGEACSTEAILANLAVDIVVNLAPPALHHSLGRAVLQAGKHLYSEKPFATSLDDARDLIALAAERGLLIASAPDTFLGVAHQTVRRLADEGAIGRIVGGAAIMASSGMEHWHPNPAFFYDRGGGPLLDIGPYMVTQLVNLLGSVVEVTAIGSTPRQTRTVSSPARVGEQIAVRVPTTVNGALRFESGANIALTLSWDVVRHRRSAIELYGLDGTLETPTPNGFDGDITLLTPAGPSVVHTAEPGPAPVAQGLTQAIAMLGQGIDPMTGEPVGPASPPLFGDLRGLGLVDLAQAIRDSRPPRASAGLALHVVDVLLALERCAESGGSARIESRTERPAPL